MHTVTLNNGVRMPQLGFGVGRVPGDAARSAVETALATGYRSIDTAARYGNETEVGQAIAESGLSRENLFVTTKLWKDDQGYDDALRAFDASLERLGLEYVDLYLIHWPAENPRLHTDSWRALRRLNSEGRIRAAGLSNFTAAQIDGLVDATGFTPAVNQIELHPYLSQEYTRMAAVPRRVRIEAWSPLGQGKDLLDDPVLGEIAAKHGRSPAQVVLRWHLQVGTIAIPKSVTPSRIRENFAVFDFGLDGEDLERVRLLNQDRHCGVDPATYARRAAAAR